MQTSMFSAHGRKIGCRAWEEWTLGADARGSTSKSQLNRLWHPTATARAQSQGIAVRHVLISMAGTHQAVTCRDAERHGGQGGCHRCESRPRRRGRRPWCAWRDAGETTRVSTRAHACNEATAGAAPKDLSMPLTLRAGGAWTARRTQSLHASKDHSAAQHYHWPSII